MSKHKGPGAPASAQTRRTTASGSTAASRGRQSARERARAAERARERRRQIVLVVVASALAVIVIGGGVIFQFWRTNRSPAPPTDTTVAMPDVSGLNKPTTPKKGKPLVFGDQDAPVTITLYEDFHCPHCYDFEQQFGPTIAQAQVAGTVKIELYPMSFIDDGSTRAANAIACATKAGFGATYYYNLFYNHTLVWNSTQLIDLAAVSGGTATDEFKTCVTKSEYADWVDSINAAADKSKVTETPTMFINYLPVDVGTLTPDLLNQKIAAAASR